MCIPLMLNLVRSILFLPKVKLIRPLGSYLKSAAQERQLMILLCQLDTKLDQNRTKVVPTVIRHCCNFARAADPTLHTQRWRQMSLPAHEIKLVNGTTFRRAVFARTDVVGSSISSYRRNEISRIVHM